MNFTIVPLTGKNVEDAILLLNKIFPKQDDEENVEICFKASLNTSKYRGTLDKWKIKKLKYFVATNPDNGEIYGTTGVYTMKNDDESAWLGWTGVNPKYRNMGIGKALILHAISEAKNENYKYMKLHTVDIDYQKNAHYLYKKLGFKQIKRGDKEIGHNRIYYKLDLRQK
ncbi:MAG: GNAT family N-acetyltransferase [archaeon]